MASRPAPPATEISRGRVPGPTKALPEPGREAKNSSGRPKRRPAHARDSNRTRQSGNRPRSRLRVDSTASKPQPLPENTPNSRHSIGYGPESPVPDGGFLESELNCPICNEGMVTLTQLNRHLDDSHQNLEIQEQDQVKNWFTAIQSKQSAFPLSPIFNFLRDSSGAVEALSSSIAPGLAPTLTPERKRVPANSRLSETEEWIDDSHFERLTSRSVCRLRTCRRPLESSTGDNCRKCGRLFCRKHTNYEMKLTRSARHDPARGNWYHVCHSCFHSKEGHRSPDGAVNDLTQAFRAFRNPVLSKANFASDRLKTRVTRLAQDLTTIYKNQNQGGLWSLAKLRSKQRTAEQALIKWEDDASVSACPHCNQAFSYTLWRHHCRVCGKVVCGDSFTGCSNMIKLNHFVQHSPPPSTAADIEVRACMTCARTIFHKSDFKDRLLHPPPIQALFHVLKDLESGIKRLLPSFQKHLLRLQESKRKTSVSQLSEAGRVHRLLSVAFLRYAEMVAKIETCQLDSRTYQSIRSALCSHSRSFIYLHKVPIESAAKMLQQRAQVIQKENGSPSNSRERSSTTRSVLLRSQLESGSPGTAASTDIETSSQAMSVAETALTPAEDQEQELRGQLIVLEEQHFFVSNMLSEAKRRRDFDQVSTLAVNVDELNVEMNRLKAKLERLDFSATFTTDPASFRERI